MLFAYETDQQSTKAQDILNFFDKKWEKPDLRFMQERFDSICENRNLIDDYIMKGLQTGWSIERIDPVLYAILMTATDEMLSATEKTPLEVLVKEYADLTADFFDNAEISFVNAYLNDLKAKIKQGRQLIL
jgi:transcription termination factor NusB